MTKKRIDNTAKYLNYDSEIWNALADKKLIPKTGTIALSLELIANILKTEREIFPAPANKHIDQVRIADEEAKIAGIIFETYAKWMPKEVKVTPEFIDKLIGDKIDLALSRQAAQKNAKAKVSASHDFMMTANRLEAEGDDKQALEYFNKSVECRESIEPIIRRGMYYHERNSNKQAMGDFTLAIDTSKPNEHRLAFAFVERGLLYIEIFAVDEGLDDLIAGFDLFDKQLKRLSAEQAELTQAEIDEAKMLGNFGLPAPSETVMDETSPDAQELGEPLDSYIGTIEYFIERCQPIFQQLESGGNLSRDEEVKLKALKDLSASVREGIEK